VPASKTLAVGGSSHACAMIHGSAPGATCGDLRAQTMKNRVAPVEYTVGFPQPFGRNVRLSYPDVGEGPSHVDDECGGDQGICVSVHNSHPLLPLLSFN
jgi:hypothetical protein